jgi:hypothetical protein
MSFSYDEILSDNVFGQIIVPAPQSSSSISMTNTENNVEEQEMKSLPEQYGFSVDELFSMARQFLKGN